MEITTHTALGVDKTKRYGWVTKDEPGSLQMLHKDVLQVHPAYQRDVLPEKVKAITAAWSWLSLGALVVGERGDRNRGCRRPGRRAAPADRCGYAGCHR